MFKMFVFEKTHSHALMHKVAKMVLTSKLKTMGSASMASHPIILRYHFGNFVH